MVGEWERSSHERRFPLLVWGPFRVHSYPGPVMHLWMHFRSPKDDPIWAKMYFVFMFDTQISPETTTWGPTSDRWPPRVQDIPRKGSSNPLTDQYIYVKCT